MKRKRFAKRRNYVWVVEGDFGWGWQTTTASGITRIEAADARRSWASQNPCDRFRIVKYEAVK